MSGRLEFIPEFSKALVGWASLPVRIYFTNMKYAVLLSIVKYILLIHKKTCAYVHVAQVILSLNKSIVDRAGFT